MDSAESLKLLAGLLKSAVSRSVEMVCGTGKPSMHEIIVRWSLSDWCR